MYIGCGSLRIFLEKRHVKLIQWIDNIPDTGDYDDVLLPALEGVDAGHLQLLVDLAVEGALVLHVLHQERALTLVGRHNTDLFWLNARLKIKFAEGSILNTNKIIK